MKSALLILQICSVIIFCTSFQVFSQDSSSGPFTWNFSYIGDNVNNLHGGLKQGSCYLGMVNLTLGFDTEKVNLWKNGQFYFKGVNTHGGKPSENYIGDLQVASNIEAGNHTYVQEFWYAHTIGNFNFIVGLQDLCSEFTSTENGALYLNSSFGIHPTISANVPAPIFPVTALGFVGKWQFSEKFIGKVGVFDGAPYDFDSNPYNVRWKFNTHHVLYIAEAEYKASIMPNYSGVYKMGFFHHVHSVGFVDNIDTPAKDCYGFYLSADQGLWQKDDASKGLGIFGQLSYNPGRDNPNYFYAGVGLNYKGLFSKKGKDVAGIALAHAAIERNSISETSIELTYQLTFSRFFIQPDIQYIINPAGLGTKLRNSLEAIVRFGITL